MHRRLLVAPLLITLALGATGLSSGVAVAKKKNKAPSWQGHYGGDVSAIAGGKTGAFFYGYNPFKPASKAKYGTVVAYAVPFTCADGTTIPARTVTLRQVKLTVTGTAWSLAPSTLGGITTAASGKFVGKYANGTITMTGVTSNDTTCNGSLTFHLGPRRA